MRVSASLSSTSLHVTRALIVWLLVFLALLDLLFQKCSHFGDYNLTWQKKMAHQLKRPLLQKVVLLCGWRRAARPDSMASTTVFVEIMEVQSRHSSYVARFIFQHSDLKIYQHNFCSMQFLNCCRLHQIQRDNICLSLLYTSIYNNTSIQFFSVIILLPTSS